MNRPERSNRIWKYLKSLSEDDQDEIGSVILLTPDETERSIGYFEFENPVLSEL